MRALAITGIETASWISAIFVGSAMRATPPAARMSAGTRSSAITAAAPASSAMRAWSAVTTSMITPPLSISARPLFTRKVPVSMWPPGYAYKSIGFPGSASRPGPPGRVARPASAGVHEGAVQFQELGELGRRGGLERRPRVRVDSRLRRDVSHRRRRRALGPAPRADVVHHERAAAPRQSRDPFDPVEGPAVAAAAGVERRSVQTGADHTRLDLGGDVRHLMVAERLVEEHGVPRRVRVRVARHVPRVAVRLAAVPQDLDH